MCAFHVSISWSRRCVFAVVVLLILNIANLGVKIIQFRALATCSKVLVPVSLIGILLYALACLVYTCVVIHKHGRLCVCFVICVHGFCDRGWSSRCHCEMMGIFISAAKLRAGNSDHYVGPSEVRSPSVGFNGYLHWCVQ